MELKQLLKSEPLIEIYITNYEKYTLESFKVSPFRYQKRRVSINLGTGDRGNL